MQQNLVSRDRPAAHRKPTFTKRKYDLRGLFSDSLQVLPRIGDIYAIGVRNRLDEGFREEIMVAVSQANGCTICNFTHHDFAQRAGVSLDRLTSLERGDLSGLEPDRRVAIEYAIARSVSGFGPIDAELERRFAVAFGAQERRDIELVTRFITIMNLSCNKLEAFGSRVVGEPVSDSGLADELIISSVAMAIIPVMYGLVARVRRQPYLKVWRDFIEYALAREAGVGSLDV